MDYDIRIKGELKDEGLLEFNRLNTITTTTKEIATKALMLQLSGYSEIKPSKDLIPALNLRLSKFFVPSSKETVLTIDCDYFSKTLSNLQYDLFKSNQLLLNLSPMSLVIESFRSALKQKETKGDLDKSLIRTLLKFKKNFVTHKETFLFSNRNSIPEVEISLEDFKKIELLEEAIPPPQDVIINGRLDELKYSKAKLVLLTEKGNLIAFGKDQRIISEILNFMGSEITITGRAHFKLNGQISFFGNL